MARRGLVSPNLLVEIRALERRNPYIRASLVTISDRVRVRGGPSGKALAEVGGERLVLDASYAPIGRSGGCEIMLLFLTRHDMDSVDGYYLGAAAAPS